LGGLWFKASPGKKFVKCPSQPIAGSSGTRLSAQAMQEAEIGRFTVPGQPWQKKKVCKITSQWKKAVISVKVEVRID
jgi:hypothetical protein